MTAGMMAMEDGEISCVTGKSSLRSSETLTLESVGLAKETNNAVPASVEGSGSESLDAQYMSCLGEVNTTFEQLKVCLDDDSSFEDGEEDMFDDDAFTFGDEDFAALMSRGATKPVSTSIKSHISHVGRSATPASSVANITQSSHLPLHQSASFLSEKAVAGFGSESMPSTAASSQVSGNRTSKMSMQCRFCGIFSLN
mmetsp:Transcript_39769/g.95698  ORF Transcript_39769/g.95698 Transcript_39769/m.95698 type:complete len:198 (+) Transcript_39769:678-1271(+)